MIGYDAFLARGAAAAARRGPPRRHRHRLLRRGHRHRSLRGRTGAACSRAARCASRPASARRARATSPCFAQIVAEQLGVDVARRRGGHRRHRPVRLGRRHLRQPRRGGRRQRGARGGDVGAAEGPAGSPPSISSAPRRTWCWRTARCRVVGVAGARRSRSASWPQRANPLRGAVTAGHRAGAGGDRAISARNAARPPAACTP